MSLPKDFDCLKMKDEIQAQLRKEWEGLSPDEIRERIQHNLKTSQEPIAIWWRALREDKLQKQLDDFVAR